MQEYLEMAQANGMSYLAFTDHFDTEWGTNEQTFAHYARMCQEIASKRLLYPDIQVACGLEIGFWDERVGKDGLVVSDESELQLIHKIQKETCVEYCINSVHTTSVLMGTDPKTGLPMDRQTGFERHLQIVLQSLDAPYHYDTIGHFGFCTRKKRFENNALFYGDHQTTIDKILDGIIAKQKILEINSAVGQSEMECLPSAEILKIYKKRGGEHITFAADAHEAKALLHNFDKVRQIALDAGFVYYTIKKDGQLKMVKID